MLIYSYNEVNSKTNHLSKCKLGLECKDMDVRLFSAGYVLAIFTSKRLLFRWVKW